MGQELLLKVDVTAKPSVMGKNQSTDAPLEQDTTDVKPFSSTLDEQLEKQDIEPKKTKIGSDSETVDKTEAVKKEDSSDEKPAMDDGKTLPEVAEDTVVTLIVADEDEEILSVKPEPEKTTSETIDDEPKSNALLDNVLVKAPKTEKIVLTEEVVKEARPSVAKSNNVGLKAQEVIETTKVPVSADTSESKIVSTEQKKHSVLRSDILTAIAKKTSGDSENMKVSGAVMKTEKNQTAELLDKPFTEIRKVAEILNQNKTEPSLLKTVPERNVAGFPTVLTSGSASSVATAVQSSTVGQPVLAMQPSMQTEAWGRVLNSRVIWMAREGVQQAELRMNPANLGPVEVKLHMSHDQANVTFIAQNAATRDALEQALPKLRESFQENGMDLADANVFEHASEQENNEENSEQALNQANGRADSVDSESEIDDGSTESGELELGRVSLFA